MVGVARVAQMDRALVGWKQDYMDGFESHTAPTSQQCVKLQDLATGRWES